VLREYAARTPEGKPRRIVLRFFRSPTRILGDDKVTGIELVRNTLDENERAVATDETETLDCGIVFRSVGYRGVAIPGVPFDDASGVIPNDRGRVADRVYAAGWIKRGPSGVIGTNKKDATETVELLLEDLKDAPRRGRTFDADERLLADKGVRHVLYEGWAAIDERERTAGEPLGRPRVKLCSWEDLLDAAGIRD
jgi:ferredoxin--NADP+ reductase